MTKLGAEMNERYCTAGRNKCPRLPECGLDCYFEAGTLIRKIKPYPAIPPHEMEPLPDVWSKAGTVMLAAAMLILVVFFVTTFMMGVWLWGVLV